MKQKPPAFQFYPRQWMGDKAVLAMDWDAQGMHLWLMGIAWQSSPACCIPNEEQLIRMWLKNPDDGTWKRVWPQIQRAWKICGTFLKQSGLARELRKQQAFSRKQTENIQKRWKRRRNTDNTTVIPPYHSGNTRAGNTLQSSSAEAEEDKKKSAPLGPLGGAASLPAQRYERRTNGALTAPAPKAAVLENDQGPDYGHQEFLAIGKLESTMPADPFQWESLERSLSREERVQSKMREKFYRERATAAPGEDDVF